MPYKKRASNRGRPRSKRPCDLCRRRKTRCIIEDGSTCLACLSMKEATCTFLEPPTKRTHTKGEKVRDDERTESINSSQSSDNFKSLQSFQLQEVSEAWAFTAGDTVLDRDTCSWVSPEDFNEAILESIFRFESGSTECWQDKEVEYLQNGTIQNQCRGDGYPVVRQKAPEVYQLDNSAFQTIRTNANHVHNFLSDSSVGYTQAGDYGVYGRDHFIT